MKNKITSSIVIFLAVNHILINGLELADKDDTGMLSA